MISPEYLAGFVDGEGSLSLARRRHSPTSLEYCLRVAVYNSDRRILEKIRRGWGGTLSDVGQRRPTWKPGYALIWTNAQAAWLIGRLASHLIIKRERARALLEFQAHVGRTRRSRDQSGHLLPLSSDELAYRAAFHARMKVLNAKGRRRRPSPARSGSEGELPRPSAKYIAGFVDGEGSLMISRISDHSGRRPQFRPRIALSNTHKGVLEAIARRSGGVLVNQPPNNVRWSASYQLIIGESRAAAFLRMIMPYLEVKREGARILLRFVRRRKFGRRKGLRPKRGPACSPRVGETALAEQLYDRMRIINARGTAG